MIACVDHLPVHPPSHLYTVAISFWYIWSFTTKFGCKLLVLHLNLLLCSLFFVLFFSLSTGLHVNNVLPTVLERQETGICWHPAQSDFGQQSSWPAVGSRHLLPQWQEVLCSRCHREKPHDSTTPGRYRSLRTQVSFPVSDTQNRSSLALINTECGTANGTVVWWCLPLTSHSRMPLWTRLLSCFVSELQQQLPAWWICGGTP